MTIIRALTKAISKEISVSSIHEIRAELGVVELIK
jgi:hypothetical protein